MKKYENQLNSPLEQENVLSILANLCQFIAIVFDCKIDIN